MKFEGKNILVTGAAGFIGSHLSERLLERGANVWGVDCLTDYYSPRLKRQNLESLLASDRFIFLEKNILDLDLKEFLPDFNAVFHQAAQAGVRASWGSEFDEYIEQNIKSTQYLLEGMKNFAPELPMVMASSSSVYGIPPVMPMREDMKQTPHSPYGVTKLAAENLALLYGRNFQLKTIALRYFTVYGPRQRPDMAFTRFLTWIARGETIDVYGDGSQSRDFTYIDDVVAANIRSLEAETYGEVFNVGGGENATLNRIFDYMQEITGRAVNRNYMAFKKGDDPHTSADTTAIEQKTGWQSRVGLREGLEEQWQWVKGNDILHRLV
ncbi:MAG: NAD-dependent epimerase/dehydratase family protein [bacterium]